MSGTHGHDSATHGNDDHGHGHDDLGHGHGGPTLRQLGVIAIGLLVAAAAWAGGRALSTDNLVTCKAPPEAPVGSLATPTSGSTDPKVVIVVASDFQCPFCARVIPSLERTLVDFPEDVQIRYRFNPLPFHPQAFPAAKAALAAHRQGHFWEMHMALFAHQKELGPELYRTLAEELGLDMARFEADMESPEVARRIAEDGAAMAAIGVQGTPNFFVNGVQIKGAQSYDVFKRVIDQQMVLANRMIAGGMSRAAATVALARQNHPNPEDFVRYAILDEAPANVPDPAAAQAAAVEEARAAAADETVWKVTVTPDDAQKGLPDALVTVVVFSEFQCPFCSRIAPTLRKLEETFGDKLRIVFKHNPLDFHDNARNAALAALAAQEQGKFWEMHDRLFANQQKLDLASLDEHARAIGLDMVKFKAAMDTKKFDKRIDADMELAEKVTVRGTPNSFVNGRKLGGAVPYEAFESLVKEELAKAQKLVDEGTPRTELYARITGRGKQISALADDAKTIRTEGAPTLGAADAKVKVAVFSDFQCPYCSRVVEPLHEVEKAYGGRVALVFKHFPLPFHENAMLAAEAADAAGAQGKFWEMHDKMFANQKKLSRADLEGYASDIGLDVAKFKADLDSHRFQQSIKDTLAEGQGIGVRGTPSVYVNGRAFQPGGGYTLAAFRKAIDPLLAN